MRCENACEKSLSKTLYLPSKIRICILVPLISKLSVRLWMTTPLLLFADKIKDVLI